MYKNLKAEMSRYDIKNEDIASKLNITTGTASLKVNGKAKVTLQEAWLIQDLFQNIKKKSLKVAFYHTFFHNLPALGHKKIWQIPIFTAGIPLLSSALMSLTSVFGMGTGVTSLIFSPEMFYALFISFQDSKYTLKNIYMPRRVLYYQICLVKPSAY